MSQYNILVVDDDREIVRSLGKLLELEGYRVKKAYNGMEALDILMTEQIHLILLDVMMPKMDGFEMVRRIRQTDKQTPVLFLTARSAINDVVEGFELGANDYLKKPFGIQELIIRIKALMGKAFLFTENKVANHFEIGSYLFDPVAQTLLHA